VEFNPAPPKTNCLEQPGSRYKSEGLLREIQDEVSVVQHHHQGNEKEEAHENVEEAVAFAAGVGNICHAIERVEEMSKRTAKIKRAGQVGTVPCFFIPGIPRLSGMECRN
jgi:glutaredoxin